MKLLMLRREFHGDGVVGIDCGANIGVHTLEWATAMTGWGEVVAIEAQERIYYALAGNIALNNCFNAIAIHGAVAAEPGVMKIPCPDYLTPGSFGSLELKQRPDNEFIGQPIDYSDDKMAPVQKVPLDALNLSRVDLIKIDVEGMEIEALEGARNMIDAHQPILLIEHVKTGSELLRAWLAVHGYEVVDAGINLLGIHASDPVRQQLRPSAAATGGLGGVRISRRRPCARGGGTRQMQAAFLVAVRLPPPAAVALRLAGRNRARARRAADRDVALRMQRVDRHVGGGDGVEHLGRGSSRTAD